MAVEVAADTVFKSGTPKPLFQAPLIASDRFSIYGFGGWDVAPDGERFLLMTPAAENPTPTPFNVVLNWTSLLKQ